MISTLLWNDKKCVCINLFYFQHNPHFSSMNFVQHVFIFYIRTENNLIIGAQFFFRHFLTFENKKESLGAKSGESGGCVS